MLWSGGGRRPCCERKSVSRTTRTHRLSGHDAQEHSHDVDDDGAAGGDQHHVADDLVVVVDDPLDGQINQDACDHPDGHDGDEGSEDLCSEKKRISSASENSRRHVKNSVDVLT